MSQMFTCGPYSSAQDLRGWLAAQHFPPYALSEVVLLRPYITLTWVHSLKRPGETLSQDDDMFAIPLSEVCEHLVTYHRHRSTSSNHSHPLSNFNSMDICKMISLLYVL